MPRLRLATVSAAAVVAAFAGGVAPAARADTAPPLTTEQSGSLGRALRLWSLGLVADDAGFTATPAEGGYDVAIPVAGPIGTSGVKLDAAPVTTRASLGADGRWTLDAITLPSPLGITIPGKDDETLRLTQTWASQTGHATVDPTLAGPSSGETLRTDSRLTVESGKTPLVLTTGRAATHIEWVPSSPGRVDAGSVTRLEDIAAHQSPTPGGPPSTDGVKIHALTLTLQSHDADPDRGSQLIRQVLAVVSTLRVGDDDAELTPEQRTALHHLVGQMRDLARGGTQDLVADGIAVTAGHTQVNLDRAALAHVIKLVDGKLDLHLRLELAGLAVPGLPPGAIRDLIPKHLVLATYANGTPVDDLYSMADGAIDEKPTPSGMAGEAQARMAKAPVTSGIEELSFDLGPASVTAKGQVVTGGPGAVDGTMVIEATGLDALMKKASSDRLLKQGVPMIVFLKGIGEQNGDKVVWNLAYKDSTFTVNGTDMSSMIPGSK